jgi:hypothetical protein
MLKCAKQFWNKNQPSANAARVKIFACSFDIIKILFHNFRYSAVFLAKFLKFASQNSKFKKISILRTYGTTTLNSELLGTFENFCHTPMHFLGRRRRRRSTGWCWRHPWRGSPVSSPSTLSTPPCSSSHSGSPLSSQV